MRKWSSKARKSEPKGTKRTPKGSQWEAKCSQGEPKGSQREPNGSQKETKGSHKGAQNEPKGDQNPSTNRPSENVTKKIEKGGCGVLNVGHFESKNRSTIDDKINAKIDAETVMEIDEKTMRK